MLDVCIQKPYLAHQAMFDPASPHGWWYYFRSFDVAGAHGRVIDITVEHTSRIESPLTSFPIWQMGGAVARVGEDETAFGGRQAGFTTTSALHRGRRRLRRRAPVGARLLVRRSRSGRRRCTSTSSGEEEGEDRIRAAYGEAKYDRLKALKRQWDPDNFFRINQNISPA